MSAIEDILRQAIGLLQREDLDAADTQLQRALALSPSQPDALHFMGILRHAQGRSEEGVDLIRQALDQMPHEPGPWNNLGNIYLECQCPDDAIKAYETSVLVAKGHPSSADALNNLCIIHRKRSNWAASEQAARDALALRPEFVDAWYNLSQVLMAQGRVHEGLLANSKAITLSPRQLLARDQVIRALLLQGEREQAARLYREWLEEDPENPVVQHQLAACTGDAAPERASDAYVEQVFDSFAKSFDVKLENLHYRAPELVAQALADAVGDPQGNLDICDAGCGTGLCGPLVRPWAQHLAGCDLSVGMLKQARPRRCYDVLHKAELVYYLSTQPDAFDVIISADTLCYFGALGDATAASHAALRPGGWLIYTVEALTLHDPNDHLLQPNGRYAHHRRHVEQTLAQAGFAQPAKVEQVVLRTEGGKPVLGWLVCAQRAAG